MVKEQWTMKTMNKESERENRQLTDRQREREREILNEQICQSSRRKFCRCFQIFPWRLSPCALAPLLFAASTLTRALLCRHCATPAPPDVPEVKVQGTLQRTKNKSEGRGRWNDNQSINVLAIQHHNTHTTAVKKTKTYT